MKYTSVKLLRERGASEREREMLLSDAGGMDDDIYGREENVYQ